jgi:membrane associated rhomboid family serine protease
MRPPDSWRTARATLFIAGLTALAWLIVSLAGQADFVGIWGGFIARRISGFGSEEALAPIWLTPVTATLIHAGFFHLAFNLLVLLFCGRPIEGILGLRGMILLYLVGAYAAAAAHWLVDPEDIVPLVGSSGAVSAILGAYAMLLGRNKVKVANSTLALWLNALWLMAAWIGLQTIVGITFDTMGVRFPIAACIGGFLAGLLLARPLLLLRYRKA